MTEYKSYRIVDGKPKWVVVDENGNITNRSPSKDELGILKRETRNITKKYTDEELLEFLNIFYEKNGRIPIQIEFDNNPKYPHYNTYIKRFGTWNNALKLSGKEPNHHTKCTNKELLGFLIDFYKENNKVPTSKDFKYNNKYPETNIYARRFGSWSNALKLVEMDTDTLVRKGIINNSHQVARLSELLVLEHFDNEPIDLSGINCNSFFDGICPNGKIYDVKSSIPIKDSYYQFDCTNKEKDQIEYYFLIGFNINRTNLNYAWLVPGEIVEQNAFAIGFNNTRRRRRYNIENMKEYEITGKINFNSIIRVGDDTM